MGIWVYVECGCREEKRGRERKEWGGVRQEGLCLVSLWSVCPVNDGRPQSPSMLVSVGSNRLLCLWWSLFLLMASTPPKEEPSSRPS
jgi:hypothetical protein